MIPYRPAIMPTAPILPPRDCKQCGKPIVRPTKNQKVHSGECRTIWNRLEQRELRKRRQNKVGIDLF